ncbi:MAG: alpha/beta fold hydrolase [Saprospiraceae bacterium]
MSQRGYIKDNLDYQGSTLHFLKFGKGEKLLFALHGYAENAIAFLTLSESLSESYTIIALDLPFHGETTWRSKSFRPEDIQAIIELILVKEKQGSFSLMGYSLGGRLALMMVDHFDSNLQELWLIAPDGLENRWVDRMMKVPSFLRNKLYHWVEQPDWLINFSKLLYRWKLVTGFVPKFLQSELSTPARRDRAFGIWASLDHFHLMPLSKLKSKLIERKLPVKLFFGKKDKIIPAHLGTSLSKGAKHIEFQLLEGGHHFLYASLNKYLLSQQT